jgi:proline iminopeptidase
MSAADRFRAYRASLPRPPQLAAETIHLRGLPFAVFRTPPIPGRPALLCINGGLLFDHRLLWPALSPLASARQLVFYDQRGRGQTPAPPGARAARIEHDGADAAALARYLADESGGQIDLLGHSWGGGISLLAMSDDDASSVHQSAAISKVVLINAVGTHSEHWLPFLTERALRRLTGAAADRLIAAHEAAERDPSTDTLSEYSQAIYPAWFADPDIAALFRPPRSSSLTGATISARLRRDGYDWRARLTGRADHRQVLLLHGDADLIHSEVPDETAAVLGKLAHVVHIVGSGHNPFWEHPSIVFTEIERFLGAA